MREKSQPQTQYTKTNSLGFLRFLTESVGGKEKSDVFSNAYSVSTHFPAFSIMDIVGILVLPPPGILPNRYWL